MIALLLAAQLSVQTAPPAPAALDVPQRSNELIRALPSKAACMANPPGRMEVSLATPTALYRQGDRPAKTLRQWADYPQGAVCAVETGR